ncbi:MAG: protein kinase [Aridibacter famidurans]|nr:protein kinase [Aridibacter famidurans]
MLQPGSILESRYKIVRPLGQGGMGAVYEAVDQRFGTPVAVKEILLELGANADEAKRKMVREAFEREAKALANARHEAVPFVRDYFSEGDSEFLVMELVEGDELAELLASRRAPFSAREALGWLDQLLDALDYLHTLSPPIVHRDIKPQNLKLNARGRVKLLDFGIAKSIDAGSATVTSHTFLAATLNYSPIEQILRVIDPTFREFILLSHKEKAEAVLSQATDARCDIYALGATFYHLLTNRVPVDATKRAVEVWSGNDDPLEAPSSLNPSIPEAVSAYLLNSMAIERDDRFVSAREMRQAMPTGEAKATEEQSSFDAPTVAGLPPDTFGDRDDALTEKMRAKTEHLPLATGSSSADDTVAGATVVDAGPGATQKADTLAGDSANTLSEPAQTRGPDKTRDTGGTDVSERPGISAHEAGLGESQGPPASLLGGRRWILPAAGGAGILLGAIFLGAAWLAMPDPSPPDPLADTNSSVITNSDELPPVPTTSETPFESSIPETPIPETTMQPADTVRTPAPAPTRTPRAVADPTRPPRTPTPRPRTPTPTPKRMTDDCLYNGRCR